MIDLLTLRPQEVPHENAKREWKYRMPFCESKNDFTNRVIPLGRQDGIDVPADQHDRHRDEDPDCPPSSRHETVTISNNVSEENRMDAEEAPLRRP